MPRLRFKDVVEGRRFKETLRKERAKIAVSKLVESLARDSMDPLEFLKLSMEHKKTISAKYFSKQVSYYI